jgi:hypothetical protein
MEYFVKYIISRFYDIDRLSRQSLTDNKKNNSWYQWDFFFFFFFFCWFWKWWSYTWTSMGCLFDDIQNEYIHLDWYHLIKIYNNFIYDIYQRKKWLIHRHLNFVFYICIYVVTPFSFFSLYNFLFLFKALVTCWIPLYFYILMMYI